MPPAASTRPSPRSVALKFERATDGEGGGAQVPVPGLQISTVARLPDGLPVEVPLITMTRPSLSSAARWFKRALDMEAVAAHVDVVGSYSMALFTGAVLLKPPA